MKFKLRNYQEKVKLDVKDFLEKSNFTKGLIVMPVGSGKALCTSIIAEQVKGKVLVLQPSKELLEQNYEKAMGFNLEASIYSASVGIKEVGRITFATPMSVVKKVDEFKDVEVVVIDEAHLHSTQDLSGRKSKMGEFIDAIKPRKIIGLTATPIQVVSGNGQSELKMMVRSKRSFWYGADIFHITQIQDIADKYWANLTYEKHDVDESKLKLNSTGTDFVMESIIDMYNYNNLDQEIIDVYEELRKQGKKSILIFVPTVDIALDLESKHKDFVAVWGDMKKDKREAFVEGFKSGEIKCTINVNTLTCLSDDTEVLTKKGWKFRSDVTLDDYVAQYDVSNGEIDFAKPSHKHEHDHKSEIHGPMVRLKGRYTSFHVTNDHDMLIKHKNRKLFKKVKAVDIVGKRRCIPVSGFKSPDNVKLPSENLIRCKKWRFISQNKYSYIKKGMTPEEAVKEAESQYELKNNLKYKKPNELTLDECRFIGFFLGDGSITKVKKGVNEYRYTIAQSHVNPKMLTWIENILDECNIDYSVKRYNEGLVKKETIIDRECNVSGYNIYSLNKGTGGHKQNKNGIFRLIPYLKKEGSDLFWGLNREQYFCIMEGLFMANGNHGNADCEYTGQGFVTPFKELADVLQAVGVCRGFRVSINEYNKGENFSTLYNVSLRDKQIHEMVNDRPFLDYDYRGKVWCLTMPKGTLITRHRGKVTIMGNTGFDHPELDAIIMARSTNSFALYLQIIGRLVRPILKDGEVIRKEGTIVDLTNNVDRFGQIENITFERNDYTKGWAMWNGDRLLTGLPFGNWKTPTREQMKAQYERYLASKNKKPEQQSVVDRYTADTLQSGHDTIFHFGKFKGQKFTEVWGMEKANGPGRQYITWILSNRDFNWSNNYMRKFRNTLEEFVVQMAMEGI